MVQGKGVGFAPAGRRVRPNLRVDRRPYLIENPVGTLSTYWRAPDHKFDPCEYAGYLEEPGAEADTKRTCLWTGGGFRMPPPRPVPPSLGSKTLSYGPGPDGKNFRAATPGGFARAVFLANAQPLSVK